MIRLALLISDRFVEVSCCPAFNWLHHDEVAVEVVGHDQVVVAAAGWVWELSRLVRVYNMMGLRGCEETCIRPCGVCGLWWEAVNVIVGIRFRLTCLHGALCVLVLGV